MFSLEKLFQKFSNNHTPRWVVLLIDLMLCAFSYVFITFIILNFSFLPFGYGWLIETLCVVMLFKILAFALTRMYQGLVRYTSINDALRILAAAFISSSCILAFDFLVYFTTDGYEFYIPIRIIVLDFLVCLVSLSSSRVAYK